MSALVIKISGHELDDPTLLTEFAVVIRKLDKPVVIVHGGGKEISSLQTKLGIEPVYVEGQRVTDSESLDIVTMVLCGLVNKRLVHYLTAAAIDAQGISGVDRNLIQAVKMTHGSHDMGYTGQVVNVRAEILHDMLEQGITPVIAPVCAGEQGHFNVNADLVTGAVAAAINAEQVIFLSNVEGVLANDRLLQALTAAETQALIANGTIYGGMIPKVTTALTALDAGVSRAVITNLHGLATHGGTQFTG